MASVEAMQRVTTHFPDDQVEELMGMSDVLLVVEDKAFPAHSQLLAAFSGVFRHMLYDLQHPISGRGLSSGGASSGQGSSSSTSSSSGREPLKIKEVPARDFLLLLKYLYTSDYTMFEKIDDAKVLADLAQRFDIPSIIKNCVPWVIKCSTDFLMNAYSSHFDALYWLEIAEAWQLKPLQLSCMAAIADEISFYSAGEGEYWSGFDMNKVAKMRPEALFVIARAVAEACSRNIIKKEVRERIKDFERIISRIMDQQEEARQRSMVAAGSSGLAKLSLQQQRQQQGDQGSGAGAGAAEDGAGRGHGVAS